MLLNPAVIALIAASVLVGAFTLYACGLGLRILWQYFDSTNSTGQTQVFSPVNTAHASLADNVG